MTNCLSKDILDVLQTTAGLQRTLSNAQTKIKEEALQRIQMIEADMQSMQQEAAQLAAIVRAINGEGTVVVRQNPIRKTEGRVPKRRDVTNKAFSGCVDSRLQRSATQTALEWADEMKQRRIDMRIKQSALAEAVGLQGYDVSDYEHGRGKVFRYISVEHHRRIMDVLTKGVCLGDQKLATEREYCDS